MDEADRDLISFVAAHRFVIAQQAQRITQENQDLVGRRLGRLATEGLIRSERMLLGHPRLYRVTRAGLTAIDSSLPLPTTGLGRFRHAVGVAWLWLASRYGAFGEANEVLSNRELTARTRARSVRGASGDDAELALPDLRLELAAGGVAIHLELGFTPSQRLDRVLAQYGEDPSLRVVLYLVDDPRVGASVEAAARRVGLAPFVRVQPAQFSRMEPIAPDA